MKQLKGKTALVTGASRGVGYATAVRLVQLGCNVVITARTEKRLEQSKAKLEAMGGNVEAVAGDVGNMNDAQSMVQAAIDRFGSLDLLINNAGISMRGNFADLTPELCDRVIDTNLVGSVYVTRAAVEHVVQAKGSIVFISSIAGLFGLPGSSIYCATKGALTGLCDSLRIELSPQGVHVGVVYLGFTEHDPEKRILAADGTPLPPDRPAHHSQDYAAGLILKLIEKRKRNIVMTPAGHIGAYLHRISPSLVEKAILTASTSQWAVFKRFNGESDA